MIKRIGLALAGCLMITACGGSLNNAIQSSVQSSKPQLDVETEKAFSGVNQVVIGSFNIGFDTFKTESVKAEGGLMGSGFGGKSTAKSTLTGVDKATMQAITDAAYQDFVQTLKANGYTVASRSDLVAHDDFKGTNVLDNPTEVSEGGMLGGGTEALYFSPSSFEGVKPFMGDVPGVTGGFGWSNPSSGASLYAEKTGIPVLHVSYRVDFANAEKYGGWHTNTSSINVDQGAISLLRKSRRHYRRPSGNVQYGHWYN